MFTTYGFGISNGFIHQVMERLADLGAVGVFHTEDDAVCTELLDTYRSQGRSDSTWYPKSRPDYAEAMAAEDVLRIATATGAKYYGVHTSCQKTASVIEQFRDDGTQIRTETCTHYTALDESAYEEHGNRPLIAPPLRKPDDIEAMFEHLRRGTVDVVATDHSPHYAAEKAGPWWDSPYGAGSLQVSVPVFHEIAVNERNFPPEFLVSAMSTAPARTFGLEGNARPGTDADIVLFDPSETFTIRADDSASKQDFTLYEGREVTGVVDRTFVRGAEVVSDGELVAGSDHGNFVPRTTPDWSV